MTPEFDTKAYNDIGAFERQVRREISAGFKSKKRKSRFPKCSFRHRERLASFGELLPTGGSRYGWLGTGEQQIIHGFIDDATGRIVSLYMVRNECLTGYLWALRAVLGKSGIPESVCADKTGVLSVNAKKNECGRGIRRTQMGGIPQANGRIERMRGNA